MFETVQLLSLGGATVIGTVVLLALVERRNQRLVRTPLLLQIGGAWLWYAGLLGLVLLLPEPSAAPLQRMFLVAACAGALLMPCAMSHALLRLWRTGLAMRKHSDLRHGLAYVPMLALAPAAIAIEMPAAADLFAPLATFALPYVAWTSAVNLAAGVTFLYLRRRDDFAAVRSLFAGLAALVFLSTLLHVVTFLVIGDAPFAWVPAARLACALMPAAMVLVLAWFVVRHNVLHMEVDRSAVYAGVIVAALLGHQLLFQHVSALVPEQWRASLVFFEAIALAALVLVYPPLRHRSAEALRYLMGAWVAERRRRLQQLAAEMPAHANQPPGELVGWFGMSLRQALDVDFVAGWLFRTDPGDNSAAPLQWGESKRLDAAAAECLCRQLCDAGMVQCSACGAPTVATAETLRTAGASLAVVKPYRTATGLLLIGKHRRNHTLIEEEKNAVLLLVEQLAVTIENGRLQAEQLEAQRRAAQSEKLSALGLLASSIAHEVKNPLSAMKTITTVLAEDLGTDSPHAEDVQVILGEIDRLAATTTQLLDFARPRGDGCGPASIAPVVEAALRMLRHRARQQNVTIDCAISDTLPAVGAAEPPLREIMFNLLANAIDAASPDGHVAIECAADAGAVVTIVSDSGPGIAAEVRARLFEPFLTTKVNGTGLGLYAVGRRVRELGGAIACSSDAGRGTTFTVRLPVRLPARVEES
jgi:signal transduction histidine kinase